MCERVGKVRSREKEKEKEREREINHYNDMKSDQWDIQTSQLIETFQ